MNFDPNKSSTILQELGISTIINCRGFRSIFGTPIVEEVIEAQAVISPISVDMQELQTLVGEKIALLTNNEAACVCPGAAAGLLISVLASLTQKEPLGVYALAHRLVSPKNIIIHRSHRVPIDQCLALAPIKFLEIGHAFGTEANELEYALQQDAAAVIYMGGREFEETAVPFTETVQLCNKYATPLIVDAAGILPPIENLWRFTSEGADIAIFSGAKDLRGPQSAGFMVGKKHFISLCQGLMHPCTTIARSMKIGKEEVVGMWAAIKRFCALDHIQRTQKFEELIQYWEHHLKEVDNIKIWRPHGRVPPGPAAFLAIQPLPEARYTWEEAVRSLWAYSPRIAVTPYPAFKAFRITPAALEPGEEKIVLKALQGLFSR